VLQRWTQLFSGHLLVQRFLAKDSLGKAELQRVEKFAEEYRSHLLDIFLLYFIIDRRRLISAV
jgi:hypothetical protein